MSKLPSDTHMHTPLCKHATGEPGEYASVAQAKGVEEIIFCDHAPAPDGYDGSSRMILAHFPDYTKAIIDLRDSRDEPRVGLGIEADYYDGCEPFQREWLPAQKFDMVIGSIHFVDDWGFDNPANLAVWDAVDVRDVWRRYFTLVGALADTRMYDVVGHLDLPKKFGHKIKDADLSAIAQPAMDRIAAAGMAVELNTGGLRKPVKEIYPSALLLALARERDIPICFGSDAHAPDEVGYAFDQAVVLAEEAGYNGYVRFHQRTRTFTPFAVR